MSRWTLGEQGLDGLDGIVSSFDEDSSVATTSDVSVFATLFDEGERRELVEHVALRECMGRPLLAAKSDDVKVQAIRALATWEAVETMPKLIELTTSSSKRSRPPRMRRLSV